MCDYCDSNCVWRRIYRKYADTLKRYCFTINCQVSNYTLEKYANESISEPE